MLNIIHKQSKQGKTFAEISSVSSIPKGMDCPKQINKSFILSYDEWDDDKFNSLPDFIKDKMKQSAEYKQLKNPLIQETPVDDSDLTFSNKEDNTLPF
jgi:hypothetical protein